MTTLNSPGRTPGANEASPASTTSLPNGPAMCKPEVNSLEWYMDLDRRIYTDPDWAHRWTAQNIDLDGFKDAYRQAVEWLYDHPDRERGSALAWQLHDAVRAVYADRSWRRRNPVAEPKPLAIMLHGTMCDCAACRRWMARWTVR